MYAYLVLQCLMGLLSISLNSVVFSFYWGHVMGERAFCSCYGLPIVNILILE